MSSFVSVGPVVLDSAKSEQLIGAMAGATAVGDVTQSTPIRLPWVCLRDGLAAAPLAGVEGAASSQATARRKYN